MKRSIPTKRDIWRQIRFFILFIPILMGFFSFWSISWLGPWLFDQGYFPPHLTWGGEETIASSVTINFRTPVQARVKIIYAPQLSDGNFGAEIEYSENSSSIYHSIPITGLNPDTKYHYKIEEITNNLNSGVRADLGKQYVFKTAPVGSNRPFNFIVYGDNRPNFFGSGTADRIDSLIRAQQNISFTINTGDIVMLGGGAQWQWRRYFMENQHMRSMLSFPSKGNHEVFLAENDPEHSEFEFNHAFPGNKNYYSYNYSNAHFIILDYSSSHGPELESSQIEMKSWLHSDLSSINSSSDIDWVFISQHYPLHTALGSNGVNMERWNYLVRDELDIANVVPDMVFTGHVHCYERNWFELGDLDGDGNDDGVWNIISGGGGAEVVPAQWEPLNKTRGEVTLSLQNHYCSFKIDGNRLEMKAILLNGNVADNLTIIKEGV